MNERAAFLADLAMRFAGTLLERVAERPLLHLAFVVGLAALSIGVGEAVERKGWRATAWCCGAAGAFALMLALGGGGA